MIDRIDRVIQTGDRDPINRAARLCGEAPLRLVLSGQLIRSKRGERRYGAVAIIHPQGLDREKQRCALRNGDVVGYHG